MSREERRNYQRMMRNVDRGPALPPAAQARAERSAAKRAARRSAAPPAPPGSITRRYLVGALLGALATGYLAFSLQWPNMPFAAYVGIAVAIVAFVAMLGLRRLQGRLPPPPESR